MAWLLENAAALAVIFAFLCGVAVVYYRARSTEDTVKKLDLKFDRYTEDNIRNGLLIEQNRERQNAHEKRCEEDKDRIDKHLDRIYNKLEELRREYNRGQSR